MLRESLSYRMIAKYFMIYSGVQIGCRSKLENRCLKTNSLLYLLRGSRIETNHHLFHHLFECLAVSVGVWKLAIEYWRLQGMLRNALSLPYRAHKMPGRKYRRGWYTRNVCTWKRRIWKILYRQFSYVCSDYFGLYAGRSLGKCVSLWCEDTFIAPDYPQNSLSN